MLRTRLTEKYGLDVPFVGAGMGFVALPPLAAAVSNAGGLGVVGPGLVSPENLREMIREVRGVTTGAYGVDLIPQFYSEAHIEVCIEEQVPVVIFFWDWPAAWARRLRENGARVWLQAGSIPEALEAVQDGVDAIVAQGSEAGGHNRSSAATVTLVPAMVEAVGPVPVLAAGGIADGRGAAAALALGAEGVWVGTRLLASEEAYAHPEYQRRVLMASVADTVRTTMFGPEWPRAQTRVLRNRVVNQWSGREGEIPPAGEAGEMIGRTVIGGQQVPMPKFSVHLPLPSTTGDFEEMCLLAGESAGLTRQIKPAREIVTEMMAEAERIISCRLAPTAAKTTAASRC